MNEVREARELAEQLKLEGVVPIEIIAKLGEAFPNFEFSFKQELYITMKHEDAYRAPATNILKIL